MRMVVAAIALAGCVAEPGVMPGDDDPAQPTTGSLAEIALPRTASVAEVLAWLDAELPARSPGTDLSITFEDLDTRDHNAIGGDVLHVSASSAKAWWVAAAIDGAGLDAVAPYAEPIFRYSDNSASGSVIDLIGPNAVNTWMWDVAGMSSSALTQWNFDTTRVATNSPRAMGGDNYMTSNDAITFLARLYRGDILTGAPGDQLLVWLTLSPNTGLGGWIPARLPAAEQQTTMHKAGWLPPGCCSNDSVYNTANDIGIVVTEHGRAYAIAILSRRGTDYWGKQVPYVELASCLVYRAFVQDETIDCNY